MRLPGLLLLLLLWPLPALAQRLDVRPDELHLSVEIEDQGRVPLVGEQVLITIRGQYRRHITRETLLQPDLEGFSWAQLGPDSWTEERIRGRSVKIFTRRMALYPTRAGVIEIGPFTHKLTLTDEGDDWFGHEIQSAPVSLSAAPAPAGDGWWFPVGRLRISDEWSNPPEQLKPGEGVLRVIRLEALGVTPEMIPPMPELASPSGMIFPHPERRFAELTPEGPVTYAFWRWTIRPSNGVSAIVGPLTVPYFDTESRTARAAVIPPQRVAYGDSVPQAQTPGVAAAAEDAAALPGWAAACAAVLAFAGLLGLGARGAQFVRRAGRNRLSPLSPRVLRLLIAARSGDARQARRLAHRLVSQSGKGGDELKQLDQVIFAPGAPDADLRAWVRGFLRAQVP